MNKLTIHLILLIISTTVYAEPSPTVKYLMNDSLTMFDLGLYRLDNYIKERAASFLPKTIVKYNVYTDVGYNWNTNKIIIKMSIVFSEKITEKQQKEFCKRTLDNYKKWLPSVIPGFFMHHGFQKKDEPKPKKVKDEILNIAILKIAVYPGEEQPSLIAKSALMEDKIFFTDVEVPAFSKTEELIDSRFSLEP